MDLVTDGDPQVAVVVRNEVAAALGRGGRLEVLSSEDLRRLMDVAAGRAAAGCADDAGCLAEVGNALGARYVVHGNVGTLGGATLVQISLFDTEAAVAIGRETAQADTLDALVPAVRAAASRLRLPVLPEGAEPFPWLAATALGAGATVLAAGAIAAAVAWPVVVDVTLPSSGGPTPEERQGMQAVGAAGVIGGGVGVALAGVGALLLLVGDAP